MTSRDAVTDAELFAFVRDVIRRVEAFFPIGHPDQDDPGVRYLSAGVARSTRLLGSLLAAVEAGEWDESGVFVRLTQENCFTTLYVLHGGPEAYCALLRSDWAYLLAEGSNPGAFPPPGWPAGCSTEVPTKKKDSMGAMRIRDELLSALEPKRGQPLIDDLIEWLNQSYATLYRRFSHRNVHASITALDPYLEDHGVAGPIAHPRKKVPPRWREDLVLCLGMTIRLASDSLVWWGPLRTDQEVPDFEVGAEFVRIHRAVMAQ
jgi:hypothetical protein